MVANTLARVSGRGEHRGCCGEAGYLYGGHPAFLDEQRIGFEPAKTVGGMPTVFFYREFYLSRIIFVDDSVPAPMNRQK